MRGAACIYTKPKRCRVQFTQFKLLKKNHTSHTRGLKHCFTLADSKNNEKNRNYIELITQANETPTQLNIDFYNIDFY